MEKRVPGINRALRNLPNDIVYREIKTLVSIARSKKVPLVIIGSSLEKFIKDEFKFSNVIWMDTETALPFEPMEKHCVLLFNWCCIGEAYRAYDIRAIDALQPLAFLSIHESVGGSGSQEFHLFLQKLFIPAPGCYNPSLYRLYLDHSDFPLAIKCAPLYRCEFYHEEICEESKWEKTIYCVALCKK